MRLLSSCIVLGGTSLGSSLEKLGVFLQGKQAPLEDGQGDKSYFSKKGKVTYKKKS